MTRFNLNTSLKSGLLGLGTAVALLGFGALSSPAAANSTETYRQLNLFGDVFERVREDYVDKVEDKEIVENAINGMLTSLDPHSGYLNADSFKDMQIQTKGEFGGLGIEVTMENGVVKVVSPIDETPAERAGVQAGDYVTHLDGNPVLGLTLSEAVEKMRGKVGTEIIITVVREGKDAAFDISIIRDTIRIRSVRHRVEGNVGYVRVTTFNEKSGPGVAAALEDIKETLGDDLQGIVLDLRNNPGGLLDQAIAISDIFLKRGEIVSTRGREARDIQRYNAGAGDLAADLPVVTLINGGSASASEIVAGALQDHRRSTIVGMRSFGKGSVQTIIPLGAHGAIRLTTARYYTPSGNSIQARGISPDIEISARPRKDKEDEPQTIAARRRGEAALRNHLTAEGEEYSGPRQTDGVVYPESEGEKKKGPDGKEKDADFQLEYALALIRAAAGEQVTMPTFETAEKEED
ncbi:MAG: S41 family peptidase [Alphaproteobacteria bacterium]